MNPYILVDFCERDTRTRRLPSVGPALRMCTCDFIFYTGLATSTIQIRKNTATYLIVPANLHAYVLYATWAGVICLICIHKHESAQSLSVSADISGKSRLSGKSR